MTTPGDELEPGEILDEDMDHSEGTTYHPTTPSMPTTPIGIVEVANGTYHPENSTFELGVEPPNYHYTQLGVNRYQCPICQCIIDGSHRNVMEHEHGKKQADAVKNMTTATPTASNSQTTIHNSAIPTPMNGEHTNEVEQSFTSASMTVVDPQFPPIGGRCFRGGKFDSEIDALIPHTGQAIPSHCLYACGETVDFLCKKRRDQPDILINALVRDGWVLQEEQVHIHWTAASSTIPYRVTICFDSPSLLELIMSREAGISQITKMRYRTDLRLIPIISPPSSPSKLVATPPSVAPSKSAAEWLHDRSQQSRSRHRSEETNMNYQRNGMRIQQQIRHDSPSRRRSRSRTPPPRDLTGNICQISNMGLMTYDFMAARMLLVCGNSATFISVKPEVNTKHQQLLTRLVLWRPPEPIYPLDMSTPANDESYLRDTILPILNRTNFNFNSLIWIAVDRHYRKPPSAFNVILQFDCSPDLLSNQNAPKSDLLQMTANGSVLMSFNVYQTLILFTRYRQDYRQLCRFYFRVMDGRNMPAGCTQPNCRYLHDNPLFHQFVARLVREEGGPPLPQPQFFSTASPPATDSTSAVPRMGDDVDEKLNDLLTCPSSSLGSPSSSIGLDSISTVSTGSSSTTHTSIPSTISNSFTPATRANRARSPTTIPTSYQDEPTHPFRCHYPVGSIMIQPGHVIGEIVSAPPAQPFPLELDHTLNLYVPTRKLFKDEFREEYERTGSLSSSSRLEDAHSCLNQWVSLRLLTGDMDLLMVHRVYRPDPTGVSAPYQLLLHFGSNASFCRAKYRFTAFAEGRPLTP